MSQLLLSFGLAAAVLDWIAVYKQWKPLEYIAKPGVMIALILWLGLAYNVHGMLVYFLAGLFFSMAGDVFLMLPRERFIAGLVSFLLAHLAYLMGFNSTLPPLNIGTLLLVILVAYPATRIYLRVSAGLKRTGETKLKTPVLIYTSVISLMLFSALGTLVRPEWATGPALMVSSGALFFFLSDAFLAWNKFVAPLPAGKLRIIILYHLGQVLLIMGAALQLGR